MTAVMILSTPSAATVTETSVASVGASHHRGGPKHGPPRRRGGGHRAVSPRRISRRPQRRDTSRAPPLGRVLDDEHRGQQYIIRRSESALSPFHSNHRASVRPHYRGVSLSQSHTFPPVVRFICSTTSCSQSTHNFPWWNPLVPPPRGFKSTDAFSARGSIGSRQRKHRGIVSRFIQTDSRGDNENLSSRSAGSYPLTIRTRRSSRRLTLGVRSRYPGGPTLSIAPGAGGARAVAAGGGVESSSRPRSGSNTRTFRV
jgi:hypothetical protein